MNISVLVTTYNGSKYLEQQLDSIRLQSIVPDEVVIIDDKSTDSSVHLLQKYIAKYKLDNWKVIVNDDNTGWKSNFMMGSKLCSGDYIFFCDQDDIWEQHKISLMYEEVINNPEIKILASNYSEIDEANNYIRFSQEPGIEKNTGDVQNVPFSLHNYYPRRMGCTYCIKRSFLDSVRKYWHPNSAHDAFSWRVATLCNGLYIINSTLIKYRQHVGGASKGALSYKQFTSDLKYQMHVCDILKQYVDDNLNGDVQLINKINIVHSYFSRRYNVFNNLSIYRMLLGFQSIKYPDFRSRISDLRKFILFRLSK